MVEVAEADVADLEAAVAHTVSMVLLCMAVVVVVVTALRHMRLAAGKCTCKLLHYSYANNAIDTEEAIADVDEATIRTEHFFGRHILMRAVGEFLSRVLRLGHFAS